MARACRNKVLPVVRNLKLSGFQILTVSTFECRNCQTHAEIRKMLISNHAKFSKITTSYSVTKVSIPLSPTFCVTSFVNVPLPGYGHEQKVETNQPDWDLLRQQERGGDSGCDGRATGQNVQQIDRSKTSFRQLTHVT